MTKNKNKMIWLYYRVIFCVFSLYLQKTHKIPPNIAKLIPDTQKKHLTSPQSILKKHT